MIRCIQCGKDVERSYDSDYQKIHVADGDFVCNQICLKNYEDGRENFFDNIGDDEFYNNWMNG